jgi:hypothetical protein
MLTYNTTAGLLADCCCPCDAASPACLPACLPAPPAAGTAPEQRAPKDQLKELQQSIADMEGERAGDVAFQKASKELGM